MDFFNGWRKSQAIIYSLKILSIIEAIKQSEWWQGRKEGTLLQKRDLKKKWMETIRKVKNFQCD